MNILVVAAVLPYPLHSGGQIRMYNLLKKLSRHHTITLVSFIRSESERKYSRDLSFCKSVHMVLRGRAWQAKYYLAALFGPYPFLLATYDNQKMRDMLTDLISRGQFDLIHTEPFYVLPSVPMHTLPVVVSEHNIEYTVYDGYVRRFPIPFLRPLLSWDVFKLKKWERNAWKRATLLTAVSAEDAGVMEAYSKHPVHLVANGVDLSAFPFRSPPKRKTFTLLFVGNFRWLPNREAAETLVAQVWPVVRTKIPEATLRIVGRDVPDSLKKQVTEAGGTVHSSVEDIAAEYNHADVLVAPHGIGGGTKFKMLEAMSVGLPVVTTAQGMAGLDVTAGKHYFQADTVTEYVDALLAIRNNTKAVGVIARNGRKLVEERYNWDTIADALQAVWEGAYAKK